MKEKVQFKKQRELGAVLTDTFKFIRLTWRTLFGLIFRIAGPALLILVLSYVFYMQTAFSNFGSVGITSDPETFTVSILLAFVLIVLSGIAYSALIYGTVMHAIKSYINNDGEIVKQEVIDGVKKNFWSLAGLSVLFFLIVFVGALVCFLPGIYLGVVLATIYAIHVFEGQGVTESISHSFNLIKGEWWITFATFLVVFLLYYFIMFIFQIPGYIYFFAKGFTMAQQVSADPSDMFDWGYIAINGVALFAQYMLYVIIVLSTAFVYFNLNEKKNSTGTLEAIESLGNRE